MSWTGVDCLECKWKKKVFECDHLCHLGYLWDGDDWRSYYA